MQTEENRTPRIGVTRWEDVAGEAVDRYWSDSTFELSLRIGAASARKGL